MTISQYLTCPTGLYWYSDGSDVSWTTLSNWWLDAGHTIAAPELPDSTKAVITVGSYAPVVDVSTWVEPENIDASATGISFTSSTPATVHNPITGFATFSGQSINGAIITGDAVFADESIHTGTINGNAIFDYLSGIDAGGTINGNAKFTYATGGTITFGAGGRWGHGYITGDVVGDDDLPFTEWVFNGNSYNEGTIEGNATFNDTSYNA